ncbi:4-hydroxy-tetrahydrodipicolinate reductase [Archangium gephyra]|uniref:4-hydroxy-tetrahydrodipicolinate reductase n=2 Tax=Archangium gephyra TaxID=48 RepID=A0ABX9JNN2_9BACT|nr:dihydrodipicolinate reductase [Archangium gephyra]REG23202.1 4-hydroxy-tetrahydrodipicolinate reductase [Archangium gephyra]
MPRASAGPVPVVVMGLGVIGQEIARAAQLSPEVELIGAVDANPQLVGRPLSDVLGGPALKVKVAGTLEAAVGRRKGAVLLHATGSRLEQVMDQLLEALKLGLPIVSTCEELAFPFLKYPELAEKLDRAAQAAGVAVLGTGVNPGFVMDRLVAVAGQACGPVRHATVTRVVDARTRREALQRKVGAGLSEDEFFALVDKDQMGHVGLVESAALCALGLGMDCDDFEEEIVPVFAEEDILDGAFPVKKGRVAGIFQSAVGLEEGQERVRLELTIAVGADNPGDRIEIEADPKLVLEIRGGVPGDRATANTLVNAAPRVTAAEAGLLTVLELPAGR